MLMGQVAAKINECFWLLRFTKFQVDVFLGVIFGEEKTRIHKVERYCVYIHTAYIYIYLIMFIYYYIYLVYINIYLVSCISCSGYDMV